MVDYYSPMASVPQSGPLRDLFDKLGVEKDFAICSEIYEIIVHEAFRHFDSKCSYREQSGKISLVHDTEIIVHEAFRHFDSKCSYREQSGKISLVHDTLCMEIPAYFASKSDAETLTSLLRRVLRNIFKDNIRYGDSGDYTSDDDDVYVLEGAIGATVSLQGTPAPTTALLSRQKCTARKSNQLQRGISVGASNGDPSTSGAA
ncbi:hypothetical protein CVT24_006950, partial [Panaeolus cyanescens]